VDLLGFLELPVLFPPESWQVIGETPETLADLDTGPEKGLRCLMRRHELCFRLLGDVLEVAPLQSDEACRLAGLSQFKPVLDYLGENGTEPSWSWVFPEDQPRLGQSGPGRLSGVVG
jgi:hypothetical protein